MHLPQRDAATILPLLRSIRALLPLAHARVAKQLRLTDQAGRAQPGAAAPLNLRALERYLAVEASLIQAVQALTRSDEPAGDAVTAINAALNTPGGPVRALRTLGDGEVLRASFERAKQELLRLADRPPQLAYVGPCGHVAHEGGRPCGTGLYARPGAAVATCRRCGSQVDVQERREFLITRAYRLALPASHIARALAQPEFGGVQIRVKDIHNWAARGKITAKGRNQRGVRLYNLGDVIACALAFRG